MNVNEIGRETVANWMMLRGYATGHGDTVQDLLFELEAQAKGRGGPPEPPPGEGDFKLLQQRVADAEAEIERLRADNAKLRDALHLVRGIIVEGAAVGFNPLDGGDWANRLYTSQADTFEALRGKRGRATLSGGDRT